MNSPFIARTGTERPPIHLGGSSGVVSGVAVISYRISEWTEHHGYDRL